MSSAVLPQPSVSGVAVTLHGLKLRAEHRAGALAHELTAWTGPGGPAYLAAAVCVRCGSCVAVDERNGTVSGSAWSGGCEAWARHEDLLREQRGRRRS
jgi:hypothetical protein